MELKNKKAISSVITWILIGLAFLLVMSLIYSAFTGALFGSVSSFSFF